jgi:hypothetical protein
MVEPYRESAFCEECSVLDIDQIYGDGYVLKPSWAALLTSAEEGCRFCRLIVEGSKDRIARDTGEYDENDGNDQVLCMGTRLKGRRNELTDCFVSQISTERSPNRYICQILIRDVPQLSKCMLLDVNL